MNEFTREDYLVMVVGGLLVGAIAVTSPLPLLRILFALSGSMVGTFLFLNRHHLR